MSNLITIFMFASFPFTLTGTLLYIFCANTGRTIGSVLNTIAGVLLSASFLIYMHAIENVSVFGVLLHGSMSDRLSMLKAVYWIFLLGVALLVKIFGRGKVRKVGEIAEIIVLLIESGWLIFSFLGSIETVAI